MTQINLPPDLARPEPEMRCSECPIRHTAVCSYSSITQLAVLERMKFYRRYDPGQTIAWGGDRLDFVASVVSGAAKLTRTLEDGRTQMVGLLLNSDFIGRPGRQRASFTVTAVTPILLCCFRRVPFEEMMRKAPEIAARLLDMTLDDLDAAREWMLLLGRKSARERISSLLTMLARRGALSRGEAVRGRIEIELPLTRESIADYLGLTIETVSRQFTSLSRDGLIQTHGRRRVIVLDFDSLMAESGDDADGALPA